MYGSLDKAGHYFSGARRPIDALYFAYFITRYYRGPIPMPPPPPPHGVSSARVPVPVGEALRVKPCSAGERRRREGRGGIREKKGMSEERMSENS